MQIKLDNLPRSQKINCIKAARWAFADTNGQRLMGLKDAKDAVEAAMLAQPKGDTFSMEGEAVESLASIRQYVNHPQGERGQNGCSLPEVTVKEIKQLKIKSKGSQVLNVPNTVEGRDFMDSFAKYLNRARYGYKRRGRGSRLQHGDQSSIPLQHSEWVAIYIEGAEVDGIRRDYYAAQRLKELESTLQEKRSDHQTTAQALTDATVEVNALRRQLNEVKGQLNLAVDKAEEYRAKAQEYNGQASELTKQLVDKTNVSDKVAVSQVKRLQPMPPMTLPLANGSKVKIVGATEIKSVG
jgi:hypothetical protein